MVEKVQHDRPESDISSRPPKRPRTVTAMRPPDGFYAPESQSNPKIAYKPPANVNFKSVFETDAASPDEDASSVHKKSSTITSRLTAGAFAKNDTLDHASPQSKISRSALVRPMKPPVFAAPPLPLLMPNPGPKQSTGSTASIFKRIPAGLVASTSEAPPPVSKPKSLRSAPPPPVLPSHKPQSALKPLPPPPHPSPSKKGKEKETSQSHLRTISTTHIALATDLSSQTGSASLLSIFLQGNRPDVAHVGEGVDEMEVRRGIDVSPVKGRRKGRGFIRNGLAERASNILARSQTAFTLWHKEMSSISSSSQRQSADLHFHILRVLHEPSPSSYTHPHSRSGSSTHPVIALCRILSKPSNEGGNDLTKDIYPVLFSCHGPPNFNQGERFEEGRDVYVWKPWYAVELQAPGIEARYRTEHEEAQLVGESGLWREVIKSKHALLCSRFFFQIR